jgi:hypothetical protein
MRPNATQLAARNPALASLVGALPSRGADFGGSRGTAPGFRAAVRSQARPAQRGQATFGYEHHQERPVFGDDFGAEGAPAAAMQQGVSHLRHGMHPDHPMHPDNWNRSMAVLERHHHREHFTRHRELVLEPNKGSDVKIERYSFPLAQALVLGTPAAFTTLTGTPSVYIRSQRVTTNAPAYNFAFLTGIQTGNVNAIVGAAGEDAAGYNAGAFDSHLDLPTLAPGIPLVVSGNYTGFVPATYTGGNPFLFTISFKGPASMTA